jgi:transposase
MDITDSVVKSSKRLARKSQRALEKGVKASNQFLQKNIDPKLSNSLNKIQGSFDKLLVKLVNNTQLNIIIKVAIALYAAFIAHTLPRCVVIFLDNILFKIILAIIIVYISSKDPSLSILIALAYILTLQRASYFYKQDKDNKMKSIYENEYFDDSNSKFDFLSNDNDSKGNIFDSVSNDKNTLENTLKKIENKVSNEVHLNDKHNQEEHIIKSKKYNDDKLFGIAFQEYDNTGEETITHKPISKSNSISNDDTQYARLDVNDEPSECNIDGSVNPFTQPNYSAWSNEDNITSGSQVQLNNINQKGCPQTFNNQECIQGLKHDNVPSAYDNNGSFHNI